MAIGLSKKFGFEESEEQNQFIDEFVKFHLEWKKVEEVLLALFLKYLFLLAKI